ncbi:MAG: YciI family protein [Candidatus Limnocylindria bacterium]
MEAAVKYLILIHSNRQSREIWDSMSEAQRAAGLEAYATLHEELAASGELLAAEALADPSQAKRISVRDGRTIATDGPFAEVKEQLGGFFLIQCEDLDRAMAIAARVPEATLGLVEVRPIMTYSGQER